MTDPSRDAATLSHIAALAYQPPLPVPAPVFSPPDRRVEATVATNTGSQHERQGSGERPRDQFTSSRTGATITGTSTSQPRGPSNGVGYDLDTYG